MTTTAQPGPYTYDNTKTCFRVVADDCGKVLARISSDIYGQRETAQLLAAAPDLLHALKHLVDEVMASKEPGPLPARMADAINHAHGVIAQAEG